MAAFWLVLLLLCFPALTGHVAATPVVDVQLEALMAFRDSITEDPWGALAGWTTSSSAHRCSWVGVSCNLTSDVLSIDLSGRHLTGTISPFLGNISTLESLDFSGNSLHGALPPQLGNLKKLQHLDLGRNFFGGTIPSSICSIPTLESLVLSGNSLHGALPPQLGNLKKLQHLDLGGNSLGGTIPSSICSSTSSLNYLRLSDNNFTGSLPPSLGSMPELEVLYVDRNAFHGSLPDDLFNCTRLAMLFLESNNLDGILNPRIGKLKNLRILYLSDNLLSGQIPPEIGNLTHLGYLNLEGNSIEGVIPVQIFELRQLYGLHLRHNRLTGSIPDAISRLHMLCDLILSNDKLSGFLPQGIKDLENLLVLDFSSNMLSGKLPVGLFFKLRSLLRLDLSRNKLTGDLAVEEEKGVVPQQLIHLDLSLNAFDGPIPKILESFKGLVYLNLSFNKFQGPVPEGGVFEHLDPSSLQGNLGLCGAKIHTPCKSNWFSKNAPLVAALSSSLGMLLLLVTTAAIITKRYRRTKRMDHLETTDQILVHCLKRFTEEDLEFATNFFSEMHVIGKSNLSTVYSGRLLEDGGKRVAVKKLNLHQFPSEYSSKCLLMELKTLGVLKHRNLVKVVGYAWEPHRLKALVLELMENGSLEDVIHGGAVPLFNNNRSRWKEVSERLRVCISIADGLVYLHTGYDFPIVHCDLKPSNILFDQEWEAHVSDFGATRMLNIHHSSSGGGGSNMSTTSSFAFQFGTVGYMAPELAYMTKVTTKVDVFSFGVVIMEFLTGTRPTEVEGQVDGHPLSLPEFVAEAVAGGADGVLPVLDRDLELTSSRDVQVAVKLLQLGVTCTTAQVGARPDMPDVLSSLLKLTKEYH